MLASDTSLFSEGVSMMLNSKKLFLVFYLFKRIFDYSRQILNRDYICITVNPKHSLTYDFLLFRDFGKLKTYDSVNGAPAIAKYLDLTTAEQECKERKKEGLYRMFFVKKTPPELLAKKYIYGPEDLRYFFCERSDLFNKASSTQMEYIKGCYPSYDFSAILP